MNFDPESTSGRLGTGWSGWEKTPERDTFAWCAARACTLTLVTRGAGERLVRFRAWSFDPPGAPPQEVTLFWNGTKLETVALGSGTRVHAVVVPKGIVRSGRTTLQLAFAHALPAPGDGRALSAAFDWLEVLSPR